MSNITYDKPFLTYDQMVDLLEKRKIQIDDRAFAISALQNFSYYSLVNGYKDTFLQLPGTDNFIPGTKFEELYTLHIIDVNLNNVLFKYILYVEQALKSRISYLVSESFGVFTDIHDHSNNNPDDYLYERNYSNSTNKRSNILRKIKECAQQPREHPSLTHYIHTKNHLPAWILTYNIPFGLTIEWYSILKQDDKNTICSQFLNNDNLTIEQRKEFFVQGLKLLREYRNKIAHGNRTFSIMSLPILPKVATLCYSYNQLSNTEYRQGCGQCDLFAVFLVILTLLNDNYLLSNFHLDCTYVFSPYSSLQFNGKTIFEVFGLPNNIIERMQNIIEQKFT